MSWIRNHFGFLSFEIFQEVNDKSVRKCHKWLKLSKENGHKRLYIWSTKTSVNMRKMVALVNCEIQFRSFAKSYDQIPDWLLKLSTFRRFDVSTIRRFDGSTIRRFDGSTIRQFDGSPIRRFDNCITHRFVQLIKLIASIFIFITVSTWKWDLQVEE